MRRFIILLLVLGSISLFAQEKTVPDSLKNWKTGGVISLTSSQVSLTNWAAGGDNSVSVNGLVSLFAKYKKNKSTWDNSLDLAYGILKQKSEEHARKSDDKIDFASKYGQYAFKHWYYAALFNFKSQFAEGYDYPNDSVIISNFAAPAYITLALGMDFKPNDNFTLFISPFTGKTTIVNDQTLANEGAFGVDPAEIDTGGVILTEGKKIRNEFGGYMKMEFKHDIMENVSLQTKLDLFSNYIENPQNVDVNWEVLIAMKVNKYISANISTHLIYDHDTKILVDEATGFKGPRTQFKEVFGVGFSYKF